MTEAAQRYRVIEKLESGGMAEVFRAESEGLQGFRKQVAIKRVLPHLSEKKKFISMFLDEARLSAQLSHSNCVQVFDIGVGDNAFFIVMEFVDGANLKSIAESVKKQGKDFPVAAAAWIAHEICKGLTYAHELTDQSGVPLQIVHRDMSPPNVLITKFGEVKIVDFGLAKASSQLERSEPGIIKGKFSYLSPEAAMGQEVDSRTDVFAVGIILWELLASQRLFLGDTDFQTVKKVQVAQVPPISQINRKVPPELERIVNKALAKDLHARYATARELGQDLVRFMFTFGQPISGYDIATIVQGTMREKQRVRQPQGSIIDKLIEEALFEFTSLKEDGQPESGSPISAASAPLFGDSFVDPTNWAKEISINEVKRPGYDPVRASLPPEVFEQGNLSALEDAEPLPASAPPSAGAVPAPPSSRAAVAPASSKGTAAAAGGKSGAAIGVAVVIALVMAAGAAWFTGFIPH
ncbi:Serine/threonine protein kinase [Labilithrix luteola]|uniref:Serine/threonine protein kinase n=1 Tax=Labilithrix luteola TaxID=1391654 RepID=A0A0K1Q0S6_9BACT|nr:serine/threonine-protein kinase [Labilithrix luteola]AKU99388.1 Serine/threonine protein kinase [Labilithrix luteola]